MRRTGAQILLECLVREGVEVIFGYPGGVVLPLYDRLPEFPQLKHVLVRHEQGAAHAADGWARASGKTGVCLATSGPGATNLVTGICTAMMDSVPMVALTGNVARNLLGKDGFQEADITGITLPITKHNYLVMKASDIAYTVREAFYIANSGRKGPVLIDIPKDVFIEDAEFHWPEKVVARGEAGRRFQAADNPRGPWRHPVGSDGRTSRVCREGTNSRSHYVPGPRVLPRGPCALVRLYGDARFLPRESRRR